MGPGLPGACAWRVGVPINPKVTTAILALNPCLLTNPGVFPFGRILRNGKRCGKCEILSGDCLQIVEADTPTSVWGIYSKSRSFNSNIATSSDRQVPFGGLRHCCKPHRRSILRRLFSKAASLLHWRPYKSSTSGILEQDPEPEIEE